MVIQRFGDWYACFSLSRMLQASPNIWMNMKEASRPVTISALCQNIRSSISLDLLVTLRIAICCVLAERSTAWKPRSKRRNLLINFDATQQKDENDVFVAARSHLPTDKLKNCWHITRFCEEDSAATGKQLFLSLPGVIGSYWRKGVESH